MPVLSSSEMQSQLATNTSLVSSAFIVTTGDVIVVKTVGENQGAPAAGVPTAPGHTFTDRNTYTLTSNCDAHIFTTVVAGSPGTLTVTVPWTGSAGYHSAVFERWTAASLAATPATNATKNVTGANGFNGSVTTTAANSQVSWCAGDWNALAPGTPGYRSSAVQDGLHDGSTAHYVAYYATQAAAAAGAQSFGLTTPAGSAVWKYLAIEILDNAGAAGYPFQALTPTPYYRA